MSRKSNRYKRRLHIAVDQAFKAECAALRCLEREQKGKKDAEYVRGLLRDAESKLTAAKAEASILKGVRISIEECGPHQTFAFKTYGLRTVFQPEMFIRGMMRGPSFQNISLQVRLIARQVAEEVEKVLLDQIHAMEEGRRA